MPVPLRDDSSIKVARMASTGRTGLLGGCCTVCFGRGMYAIIAIGGRGKVVWLLTVRYTPFTFETKVVGFE